MSSRIVIARIFGGLGNQLFIYASARRLALVNGAELVIDDVSGFERDYQYKRHYQLDHFHIPCRVATSSERLAPFSRLRRLFKRSWNQRLPFEKRRYVVQEGIDFDSRLLVFKPQGTVYLEGYWQSEEYFKDIDAQIRADLHIQSPIDVVNQQMAERIRGENAVAVHVRFFSAPAPSANKQGGINYNITSDYYRRAIEVIEERVTNAHYYVFSDQPHAARAIIPLAEERVTFVEHNHGDEMAYADLWLMKHCRYFIIANSTMSWWGAWLSDFQEKIVIAPELRLGNNSIQSITAWGFKGLIPKTWITL